MYLQLQDDELRGTLQRDLNSESSSRRLVQLIQSVCAQFSIDQRRVYATGLSMGGAVTWSIVAMHPSKFAAAAAICGPCDPSTAPKIARHDIAIWAFHGADDPRVLAESSRAMAAALREAGGRPRYTEYPGVGHDAWVDAYQDPELHTWLFRQRRSD